MRFDAIVLAGGAARRLGGADKPMLEVDGTPMLARVLDAVSAAQARIVVGPPRSIGDAVTWCQETPPGGGPVAATAAALPLTTAPVIVLLAADLPWIAPAVAPLLAALRPSVDAAMLRTGDRSNYLAAAWHRRALIAALDRVADPGWGEDCDTWPDLARARDRTTDRPTDRSRG